MAESPVRYDARPGCLPRPPAGPSGMPCPPASRCCLTLTSNLEQTRAGDCNQVFLFRTLYYHQPRRHLHPLPRHLLRTLHSGLSRFPRPRRDRPSISRVQLTLPLLHPASEHIARHGSRKAPSGPVGESEAARRRLDSDTRCRWEARGVGSEANSQCCNFNQDFSCIAVGHKKGYTILNCDPFGKVHSKST